MLGVAGRTGLLHTALSIAHSPVPRSPPPPYATASRARKLMAGAEALRSAAPEPSNPRADRLAAHDTMPLLSLPRLHRGAAQLLTAWPHPPGASLVTPNLLPAANAPSELAAPYRLCQRPRTQSACLSAWVGSRRLASRRRCRDGPGWCLLFPHYEPRASEAAPPPLQDIGGAAFVLPHALLRPVFVTPFIFNTAPSWCFAGSGPIRAPLGLPRPVRPPRLRCMASACGRRARRNTV